MLIDNHGNLNPNGRTAQNSSREAAGAPAENAALESESRTRGVSA